MSGEQFLYNRPTFPAQLDMSHPLTRGLVGCWVLNEEGGMRAFDSSPYQKHGIVKGAKGHYNGKLFGGADNINCGSVYTVGTGVVSIGAWFKGVAASQQAGNGYLIANKENFAGNFIKLSMVVTTGLINLYTEAADGVNNQFTTTGNYGDNRWHFVMGTRNDTAGIIYVDAVETKSGTLTTGNVGNETAWYIGSSGDTDTTYFVGSIGGVWIYNRLLIASEHTSLYLNPWDMFLR